MLEKIKSELNQISNDYAQIKDEDIPDFYYFLKRNELIAKYYDSNKLTNINIKKHRKWYKRKTVLIPVTAVIVLCFFITFTNPGNALADNVYRTIVQWFDNSVNISYGGNVTDDTYRTPSPQYYDSLNDVESKFNVKVICNDKASINGKIEVDQLTDSSYVIKSVYTLDSQNIKVSQTVYGSEFSTGSTLQYGQNAKVVKITLDDGMQFVGYVDNGVGYAITYVDQSSIEIYSGSIDYDSFTDFINGLKINNCIIPLYG